ncbi:hypothetical protein H0H93_001542, partial [Arthromyces matolae]
MDRFKYYAPMVRSVTMGDDGNALEEILEYYSKTGEKSFLPNLRYLTIQACGWDKVAKALTGLQSALRTIYIGICDKEPVDEEEPTSY